MTVSSVESGSMRDHGITVVHRGSGLGGQPSIASWARAAWMTPASA